MSFRVVPVLLAAFALLAPHPAQAWGFFGHETTARIAEANVKPSTRVKMRQLFAYEQRLGTPDCRLRNLRDASTWPDCLRRDGWRWGYTFAWHYRTTPICEAYEPRRNCSGGNCILAQIERNHRLLADESLPPHIRLEALAFLAHFVGDVHMPLHHGDKDDRGGNDRVTDYGIIPELNLHRIWDGALAERAVTSARPSVVRHYAAGERAELTGGDPADWGRESWQISREFVYPNAFDTDPCAGDLPMKTALTQSDIVEALPVVERRIQQAGLRLADMLDEAFLPGPLPRTERAR